MRVLFFLSSVAATAAAAAADVNVEGTFTYNLKFAAQAGKDNFLKTDDTVAKCKKTADATTSALYANVEEAFCNTLYDRVKAGLDSGKTKENELKTKLSMTQGEFCNAMKTASEARESTLANRITVGNKFSRARNLAVDAGVTSKWRIVVSWGTDKAANTKLAATLAEWLRKSANVDKIKTGLNTAVQGTPACDVHTPADFAAKGVAVTAPAAPSTSSAAKGVSAGLLLSALLAIAA